MSENINNINYTEAPAATPAEAPSAPRRSWAALFLIFALTAAITVFFVHLLRLNMLPSFYLLGLGALLLALLLLAAVLCWNPRKRLRLILGILLALITAGGCVFGTLYTNKAIATLKQIIRQPEKESVQIGLYALKEDSVSLADLKTLPLGRLLNVDREETDAALKKLGSALGTPPATIRYNRPVEILSALLSGETRVIAMNRNLMATMAGNTEIFSLDMVRELEVYTVEKKSSAAPENREDLSPFLLYVSGIDDRNGLAAYSLSDVNILAAVNPQTHQILLVSTPRDFYVQTPVSGSERDKLTHAGLYGVDTSIGTLNALYGLSIDYYFRIDFSGFKAIIDALGGVDVYSDRSFTVESEELTFHEGMNHMTGYQALVFARQRYGLEGGDRARGIHQMAVIRAVMQKATTTELLRNFFPLMTAMAGSFETTVPYDTLTALVQQQLSDGSPWNLKTFSVNGADAMDTTFSFPGEAYVMIPDEELVAYAAGLIRDVLAGNPIELPES